MELRFEQRTIYVRDLGNAFVAVVLVAGSSLSMLRMTLNVVCGAFEGDVDLQASLKQVAALRSGALSQNSTNVLSWQLAQQAGLASTIM